ncbi:M16 family metallopeptidase [Paenibacillus ginsengarvi]|uniref:Insulinase family protein n=1 Tax=Paenibacillus ginsengarvi TaxID=400777 RepID=A0A3B0C930_9BACL|nr:pitrilysin family protein [Paenibacillus ginsengarvi]RKN79246.1 insulinase family protein [Paenibacillus ginsengarvi]
MCCWVKAGSHHEKSYPYGIAHFLEHMKFKGTVSRTKERISNEVSEIGGRWGAATYPEWTRYYVHTPYDEWKQGVELLTDIVFRSTFPEREIALEKTVVVQEIRRAKDKPSDYGNRLLLRHLRGMHPERASNLGSESSVTSITREDLIRFNTEYYQPSNVVLVVTGHIDHSKLVNYLESLSFPNESDIQPSSLEKLLHCKLDGRIIHIERNIHQAQLHWGMYGPDRESLDRYAGYVAVRLLQSRIAKEIRTDRGLAYSVSVILNTMYSEGFISGYVGTDPGQIDESKKIILTELHRLRVEAVPADELSRTKKSIIGRFLIDEDHPEALNARLASEHIFGLTPDPLGFADRIRSVEARDVLLFAEAYFQESNMLFIQISKAPQ